MPLTTTFAGSSSTSGGEVETLLTELEEALLTEDSEEITTEN